MQGGEPHGGTSCATSATRNPRPVDAGFGQPDQSAQQCRFAGSEPNGTICSTEVREWLDRAFDAVQRLDKAEGVIFRCTSAI
jgi:hypothetical protein